MKPTYFSTPSDFRAWLEAHHASVIELWIGFYKMASKKVAMTYEEAVDEALCFGWIDGIIKSVDAESYMHRFSPRKSVSVWSVINVGHVKRLTAAGKMYPAGLAAFAARTTAKTGVYSFEKKTPPTLPPAYVRQFRANRKAWAFFSMQPPGYKRLYVHWIIRAKQESTRQRRLARLIAESAAGRRLEA